jgi:hypothetical protein
VTPPKLAGHPGEPNERTGLLAIQPDRERRGSDWSNLSPVVPLVPEATAIPPPAPTKLQTVLWNALAVLMVCAAGVLGWFLSLRRSSIADHPPGKPAQDLIEFHLLGQIFGYLSAALYILSRVPQLVLNWRRKSTDGLSMLFFLFACLGNVTYVLSIFSYDPKCRNNECEPGEAAQIYWKYILVNLSWLAGSLLTLFLDLGVFLQYFLYSEAETMANVAVEDHDSADGDRWDTPTY